MTAVNVPICTAVAAVSAKKGQRRCIAMFYIQNVMTDNLPQLHCAILLKIGAMLPPSPRYSCVRICIFVYLYVEYIYLCVSVLSFATRVW